MPLILFAVALTMCMAGLVTLDDSPDSGGWLVVGGTFLFFATLIVSVLRSWFL